MLKYFEMKKNNELSYVILGDTKDIERKFKELRDDKDSGCWYIGYFPKFSKHTKVYAIEILEDGQMFITRPEHIMEELFDHNTNNGYVFCTEELYGYSEYSLNLYEGEGDDYNRFKDVLHMKVQTCNNKEYTAHMCNLGTFKRWNKGGKVIKKKFRRLMKEMDVRNYVYECTPSMLCIETEDKFEFFNADDVMYTFLHTGIQFIPLSLETV